MDVYALNREGKIEAWLEKEHRTLSGNTSFHERLCYMEYRPQVEMPVHENRKLTCVDLDLGFRGDLEFLADVERCRLGDVQHVDQVLVVHQGALQMRTVRDVFRAKNKNA